MNGWMPFHADLTPVAVPGRDLLVEVLVDGRGKFLLPNHKFSIAEGASWDTALEDGILRGVELDILPRIRIDDIYVVTTEGPDRVQVSATIVNDSDRPARVKLGGRFTGEANYPSLPQLKVKTGAHTTREIAIPAVDWKLGTASYWWPNLPYRSGYRAVLHTIDLRLELGKRLLDERRQRFGFRQFQAVGDHYELNGVHVNLRGDNQQEADFGTDAYGIKAGFGPPTANNPGWPKAVDNLLRLNFNIMRIHQIPATPYMLDVADEMGLMLVAESPLRGSEQMEDFVAGHDSMLAMDREMVLRDRNHPSIVIWSAANEWDLPIREAIPVIRAVDLTRPIIADGVNKDLGPGIINMEHYVNGIGKLPVSGAHPRSDRPYGETEAVWSSDNTPQGFAWMATSIRVRRALGDADLRNYVLNNAWPNYVPGESGSTETLERAIKKYKPTGDPSDFVIAPAIQDPWNDARIHLMQQCYAPVLVADLDFDRANEISDKQGEWPVVKPALVIGQTVTRRLTVMNDDLAGDRIDVAWEVSAGGHVLAHDAVEVKVPLGDHVEVPATFSIPNEPGALKLQVTASKDGTERYREDRMLFSTVQAEQTSSVSHTAAPDIQRESTEWLDITVAGVQDDSLPRVLLIGDSITRLYYPKVQELLKGKANVARLSTSKSAGDPALIGEIAMLLQQYRFDIIQVNNGMHGWAYTEDRYAGGLKEVQEVIRRYAPQAKIIITSTTPVRVKGGLASLDPKTERVRKRNLALKAAFPDAVSFDDLFSLMLAHPEDYTSDGVHPNQAGAELEATQVSDVIRSLIP